MLTAACGPELGTLDAVTENEEDESALPGHVMPESIPAGYYSAATGKSGSDLLVALSDIVSRGRHPPRVVGVPGRRVTGPAGLASRRGHLRRQRSQAQHRAHLAAKPRRSWRRADGQSPPVGL